MHLQTLTREQQRAFMVLARQVVAADERLTMAEVETLDLLYREMELPTADADDPADALDLNYLFDGPHARAVALLNLLLVAYADNDLGVNEHDVILRMAERLDVDPEELERMKSWASRYVALVREAGAFWGE